MKWLAAVVLLFSGCSCVGPKMEEVFTSTEKTTTHNEFFENVSWQMTPAELGKIRNIAPAASGPHIYVDGAHAAFGKAIKGIVYTFTDDEKQLKSVVLIFEPVKTAEEASAIADKFDTLYGESKLMELQGDAAVFGWQTDSSVILMEVDKNKDGGFTNAAAFFNRFLPRLEPEKIQL